MQCEGVGRLWLLDPHFRTLEILCLENGRWVLLGTHSDSDTVRDEPFGAIEIGLTALWADRSRDVGSSRSHTAASMIDGGDAPHRASDPFVASLPFPRLDGFPAIVSRRRSCGRARHSMAVVSV
jgi:hypothetical protein